MKKIIIPAIIILILFTLANIDANGGNDRINCHFKATVVEMGSCVVVNNTKECVISYTEEGSSFVKHTNIDNLVMKGQEVYKNCYNQDNNRMCYIDFESFIQDKYSNHCPETKRYNDYYDGKPKEITLLTSLIEMVLPSDTDKDQK